MPDASGLLLGAGLLRFGSTLLRPGLQPRWTIVLALLAGLPFAVTFLLPGLVALLAAISRANGMLGLGAVLWKSVELRSARQYAGAEG